MARFEARILAGGHIRVLHVPAADAAAAQRLAEGVIEAAREALA